MAIGRGTFVFTILLLSWVQSAALVGQQPLDEGAPDLEARLAAQEAEILRLRERLDREESFLVPNFDLGGSTCADPTCSGAPSTRLVPLVAEEPSTFDCAEGVESAGPRTLGWYADYDDGFFIRPFDAEANPFQLKINGTAQIRHHAFSRNVETWTDSAGVTRPVRNRNAFDVERARLVLCGFAIDQNLRYFVQVDGDTDGGESVDFFDYFASYEFGESFVVHAGKRKVSASRQWLMTFRNTRFADRPMANDFFRPDRTVGVWATGTIAENFYYEAMVGNGYRTSNLPISEVDDRLTFAATNSWDPLGPYGSRIVDFDGTSEPLVRVGHSFVYAPSASVTPGQALDETDYLRLTDGTPINQTGALAPGVTVSDFDVWFYGVDLAGKWNGWSADAEYFCRWIENIQGNGAVPDDDLFQHGYYVEGGRFLIARKLDFNLRYSRVMGEQGNANEYAAATNWYPLDTSKLKFTFDVTQLDGSPLNNTTSDILAGDDGTLFRTQMQAEF